MPLIIEGKRPLQGRVTISGAKNAALPIIAATLLTADECLLENVPDIEDIRNMVRVLHSMGVAARLEEHGRLRIRATRINRANLPIDLARTMRASFLIVGPLLSRFGQAEAPHPGGCSIGTRPVSVDRDAMNALAWHAQTYLHLVSGDNVAAREAAQQVIALREANPYAASLAYSNLGILEAQAKNYDQAIDYLEQAYALNPRFYRATSALGRILLLRRQYDRAAQVLATLVEHPFADQAMDRYLYAMALAKSGQRQAALEQYRAALAHGLKGIFRLQAHWQVIWLSQFGRYAVIGVGLAAVLAYLLIAKPDGSALSLLAIAAVIFMLQRLLGRPRR